MAILLSESQKALGDSKVPESAYLVSPEASAKLKAAFFLLPSVVNSSLSKLMPCTLPLTTENWPAIGRSSKEPFLTCNCPEIFPVVLRAGGKNWVISPTSDKTTGSILSKASMVGGLAAQSKTAEPAIALPILTFPLTTRFTLDAVMEKSLK